MRLTHEVIHQIKQVSIWIAAAILFTLFMAPFLHAEPRSIAVLNHTGRTDFGYKGELQPIIDAINIQISRDFAPAWGIDAKLTLKDAPETGDWIIELIDHIDRDWALGYHYVDQGTPHAKIGVTEAIIYSRFSQVFSHEVLELLANPYINLQVVLPDASDKSAGKLYRLEICDPTYDYDGYEINGYMVSDFVFPSWFVVDGKPPYNFARTITAPFTPGYWGIVIAKPFRFTN